MNGVLLMVVAAAVLALSLIHISGERNGMGGPAAAGDSPVREPRPDGGTRSLSRAGHVKHGPNLGGPPSKPEYYPVTDSAPVP